MQVSIKPAFTAVVLALALGATALGFAPRAGAVSLSFANGNPGDWADTFAAPLTIKTSNTGGPVGAGFTVLPNTDGFIDAGPTTQFGYTYFDTSSYGSLSQSIAVYLDPNKTTFQSGQFMLDEAPNATVANTYGGGSPTLWGAEEDIIVTGTTTGITLSGSTGFKGGFQQFTSLGTITVAGWYDFQMTWTRGTAATDPVSTTLSVNDLTSSSAVGSTTNPDYAGLNGGEPDLWQSQYLAGPGYMWFTFWDPPFSNGKLKVADIQVQGQSVPEPGSLSLFAVGSLALLLIAARRRHRA